MLQLQQKVLLYAEAASSISKCHVFRSHYAKW